MTPAWTYKGGPPLVELTGLYVLPQDLLIGAWERNGARLYAFSAARGKLLWARDLSDRLLGRPPAFIGPDDLLYTVGFPSEKTQPRARAVLALDPRSGRLVRQLPLSLARDLYVQWQREGNWLFLEGDASPATLVAVSLAEWKIAWNSRLGHPASTITDVAAGSGYVAALVHPEGPGAAVHILSLRSGQAAAVQLVRVQLDRIARSGSVIYLPDAEGKAVRGLSLDSGRTLWHYDLRGKQRMVALRGLAGRSGPRLLVQVSEPGSGSSIILLEGASGRLLWTARTKVLGLQWAGDIPWDPQWRLFGGDALVGLSYPKHGCEVFALSAATGRFLWRRKVGLLSPELGDKASCGFVMGEGEGAALLRLQLHGPNHLAFVALDPATGAVVAKAVDPGGVNYTEVAASDGRRLYFVGSTSIRALQVPPGRESRNTPPPSGD